MGKAFKTILPLKVPLKMEKALPPGLGKGSLTWSGAKEIRTPDLLHAITRQHVHPRLSVQATVLLRPRVAARVPASCDTSVLYRFWAFHPARHSR